MTSRNTINARCSQCGRQASYLHRYSGRAYCSRCLYSLVQRLYSRVVRKYLTSYQGKELLILIDPCLPCESLLLLRLTRWYFSRLRPTPLYPRGLALLVLTAARNGAREFLSMVKDLLEDFEGIELLDVKIGSLIDVLEAVHAIANTNDVIIMTPFTLEHITKLIVDSFLYAKLEFLPLLKGGINKGVLHPLQHVSIYDAYALCYSALSMYKKSCVCSYARIDQELLALFEKSGEYAYAPQRLLDTLVNVLEQESKA